MTALQRLVQIPPNLWSDGVDRIAAQALRGRQQRSTRTGAIMAHPSLVNRLVEGRNRRASQRCAPLRKGDGLCWRLSPHGITRDAG